MIYFAQAARQETMMLLTHFDISENSIETQGMKILASVLIYMPNLRQLRLQKNYIGEEGAMYLANAARGQALTHLKVLDIADNAIETGGMEMLASVLKYLSNLIELHISGNRIGDAGVKALSEAIKKKSLSKVYELFLNNNNIGEEGMQALWSALSTRQPVLSTQQPPLIYVYLSDNLINVWRNSNTNVRFIFHLKNNKLQRLS